MEEAKCIVINEIENEYNEDENYQYLIVSERDEDEDKVKLNINNNPLIKKLIEGVVSGKFKSVFKI